MGSGHGRVDETGRAYSRTTSSPPTSSAATRRSPGSATRSRRHRRRVGRDHPAVRAPGVGKTRLARVVTERVRRGRWTSTPSPSTAGRTTPAIGRCTAPSTASPPPRDALFERLRGPNETPCVVTHDEADQLQDTSALHDPAAHDGAGRPPARPGRSPTRRPPPEPAPVERPGPGRRPRQRGAGRGRLRPGAVEATGTAALERVADAAAGDARVAVGTLRRAALPQSARRPRRRARRSGTPGGSRPREPALPRVRSTPYPGDGGRRHAGRDAGFGERHAASASSPTICGGSTVTRTPLGPSPPGALPWPGRAGAASVLAPFGGSRRISPTAGGRGARRSDIACAPHRSRRTPSRDRTATHHVEPALTRAHGPTPRPARAAAAPRALGRDGRGRRNGAGRVRSPGSVTPRARGPVASRRRVGVGGRCGDSAGVDSTPRVERDDRPPRICPIVRVQCGADPWHRFSRALLLPPAPRIGRVS